MYPSRDTEMEAVTPTKSRLHTKEIFLLLFSLRIYQPDQEAGYSFPIGVAGVTQTREEVEQVDLKN